MLINRSEVPPDRHGHGAGLHEDHGTITHDQPGKLVVPAMYEMDLRLKTDAAMQIEYFVRVRDDDDRLLHNDADTIVRACAHAVPTAA